MSKPGPPTPGPNPPIPPKPTDANVGTPCTKASDKCGNADGKSDYCCGIAAGGMVYQVDGKTVTTTKAPNIVICNGNPDGDKKPIDYSDLMEGPDGTLVTAKYPSGQFTCLSGAKALVASAAALIAAAAMI